MTEEKNMDFEKFSEMLDSETESLSGEEMLADAQLMLELRRVLKRDTESLSFPSEFAVTTARSAEQRYSSLSWFERTFDESRLYLFAEALQGKQLLAGIGLTTVALGLAVFDLHFLSVFGTILALLSLGWLLAEKRFGDPMGPAIGRAGKPNSIAFSIAFYAVPILAALATGLAAGGSIAMLAELSLSFKTTSNGSVAFPVVVGGGVFVLILKACSPLWKAVRAQAGHSLGLNLGFQLFHGAWLAGLTYLLAHSVAGDTGTSHTSGFTLLSAKEVVSTLPVALGIICGLTLIATILVWFERRTVDSKPDLRLALRSLFSSALLSFVPIILAVVGFYQMHLTREITELTAVSYDRVVRDSEAFFTQKMAIRPEENGFTELRPFLIRTEQEKDGNMIVAERLKGLAAFYLDGQDSYANITSSEVAEFRSKKSAFLEELPRIVSALKKPEFSHLPTEGYGLDKFSPDFVTYRAITQGLSLLTQEALAQSQEDQALDYVELALKWATKEEASTLLGHMIQIAQLAIVHEPLESAILSGKFTDQQLERLAQMSKQYRFEESRFATVMKLESFTADRSFREILLEKDLQPADFENLTEAPGVMAFLPKSFWESERKAYWNYQLNHAQDWAGLSHLAVAEFVDPNPLNVTSSVLVPNTKRAQAQFCYIHSKFSSLIVMCELERYKNRYGSYPEGLKELVPDFLTELPKDLMGTKILSKRDTFSYQKTKQGYRLTSSSPVYDAIGLAITQVYGQDGESGPNKKR